EFVKLENHDQIGRTEDFDMGAYATAQVGWATAGFGSSRDAIPLMLAAGDGYQLRRGNTPLYPSVSPRGLKNGTPQNSMLSSAGHFYDVQGRYRPFRLEGN